MARDVGQALQAGQEQSDAELAAGAKSGNIDAFGELVERYKERA
jgi:hypothetical protein